MKKWQLWAGVGLLLASLLVPLSGQNDYTLQVLFRVFLFAAMGLAWNLVGGYAGQLSLGHAAYFGLGAYGLTLLVEAGVPAWPALLLAALISTLFAAAIGLIAFRLRGPYFTLSTIAFAEMLRLLVTNLKGITEGAVGMTTPGLFSGRLFWTWFYYASVVLACLALLVNLRVSRSKFGYYLMAIREDEETAMAIGIDSTRYKLGTLILSAFLTALGGAIYGSAFQFIVPDNIFSISISVQIAIIVMIGGAGTVTGPLVGAVVLLLASETFKNAFQEAHLLIYGILIVLVVLFLPEGIVGGLSQRIGRARAAHPAARA
jgi:branched-chain amino acid transport system permease protein